MSGVEVEPEMDQRMGEWEYRVNEKGTTPGYGNDDGKTSRVTGIAR